MKAALTLAVFFISTAADAASLWDHNGSVVSLEANGAIRKFHYTKPKPGLPVTNGTLLFDGRKDGNNYSGTAYIFNRKCGPRGYSVSGPVSEDQRTVTMRGQAPRLDLNCKVIGYKDDRLVFTFQEPTTAPTAQRFLNDNRNPPGQAVAATRSDPCATAETHWKTVEKFDELAGYEDHLARFPNCDFATLAEVRIKALKAPAQPPTNQVSAPQISAPVLAAAAALSAERERGLKPMDTFKECDKCPSMVVVPAGSFMMGSPSDEEFLYPDEGPQHRVTFARPFAVGQFAVTFDEWDACVADGGCNGYNPSDQGWGRGRRPVINVSWDDAKAYVAWLAEKTGKSYRLLSEAEREYVTRAGTTTAYWWGNDIGEDNANCSGCGSQRSGEQTAPVDSFKPNPWDLYQVHGNVREWVEDWCHDSYAGAPTDGAAWASGDCGRRVLRGGSWGDYEKMGLFRSAKRDGDNAGSRVSYVGFRVGRTLIP
jgi:formylglycine-generating enzyme required for sulfatase activity